LRAQLRAMPRIPLEDNYTDIISKAQRGLKVSDEELARRAEVSVVDLIALKEGRLLAPVLRRVARHLRLGPDALEQIANRQWYPTSRPGLRRSTLRSRT
jgi:hydroxyacylglutathione hydrolase